jgi:replicative DNA helicase
MSHYNPEASVLGACMCDPQAFWKVADVLTAEDFALPANASLWNAIAELRKAGKEADGVTVAELYPSLERHALEVASQAHFAAANVRQYGEMVIAKAVQRRVNAAGQRIAKLAGEDSLGEAQKILATCQPRIVGAVRPIGDYLGELLQVMQQRTDATELLTGVPTSLPWLDEQTSGWQRGDLIILAARPSVGKTALALQCALHAAQTGHPVFFASLEQSGLQLAERSLAHLANVPLQNIMQPKRADDSDWTRITPALGIVRKLPLQIDETGALTVEAICARARQVNAEKRLSLIVIDYLTQITPPRADKVADGVQQITRALKAMAKELGVPVMLLSQLNREGAEKPLLKHLRDSGAIEQDADVVVFLHRPDDSRRDLVELTIAKQRNGPCDSTFLAAHMDRMRFVETADRPTPPRNTRGFGTFASRSAQAA